MGRAPDAAQARTLAEAIYERHLAAEDRSIAYLPATGAREEDLLATVIYLVTHEQIPADIPAALAVIEFLRVRLDRHELALLRAGRRHNVPYSVMATAVGLLGRQGIDGRIVRLEAAAHDRKRREKDERAFRAGGPREGRWLEQRRRQIRGLARAVLGAMEGRPWWSEYAAETAEDLEAQLRLHDFSTGEMMADLSVLAVDWRDTPDAPHGVVFEQLLALALEWRSLR